ncbi:MFS transporter [Janibacter sp. CX7]|uniref:MFS transporter n=1 Tax=Janibacter sp. CX7 TaxID=2963431 RepID=UPI0020CE42AB|nr:MFS transporter [Janibacter sp. CX7]UTT66522.1 MFS transporter [Janibacter sp. CX7]
MPRSKPTAQTSARLVLLICALSIVFEGYDMVAYGVTLPSMLADPSWGLSTEYAGVVGSYALIGMLAGSIACGAVSDLVGRRWLMIGSTAWYSLWTGVCALAPDATLFGVARFMVGFGVGALIPLAAAMAVEFAPKGRAHAHSAVVWAGYPAGGVLASLLGLWVVDAFGPRAMYAIGTIPLILFVPLMVRHLPESPSLLLARGRQAEAFAVADAAGIDRPLPPMADERTGPRGLFTRRLWLTTVLMGVLSACGLMLTYGLNTWLPKIMESTGFGSGSALGFLLALNAGAILVPIVVSRASDRIGAQVVTAGTLAAAAVAIIVLSTHAPIGLLYVMAFVAGAGTIGAQVLIYGFAAASFPASCRAAGTAWTASVGRIGGIAGPTLVGLVIAGGSVSPAFYLFAGVACFGAVVSLLVPRRRELRAPAASAAPTAAEPTLAADPGR